MPKYNVTAQGDQWYSNVYRIKRQPLFWMEVSFLSYLITTLIYCIRMATLHMIPYLIIFTMGFLYFVTLSLKQVFLSKR